jgi:hypothetical protein
MSIDIRRTIIRHLYYGSYWGRRPANFDDIYAGVPRHVPKREFMKECKKLVKEGFLLMKPGEFGPRFGLNPVKKEEIIKILQYSGQ